MNLQASHSRNSHDWTVVRTSTGRHIFLANKKGVSHRIGLLVKFMAENGHVQKTDMVTYLQATNESYNINDVGQPIRQMVRAGIVKATGNGREATYSLTSNGKRIWKNITRKWVGR